MGHLKTCNRNYRLFMETASRAQCGCLYFEVSYDLEHPGLLVSPQIVLDEVETKNPEGTGYIMLLWPRNV